MTSEGSRRAVRLGILNRAFGEVGKTFADPNVVLSLLARQLGASNVLVGLLSTLRYGGWFLPQLIVAHRVQGRALRGRVYCAAELFRCGGYAVIAILLLTVSRQTLLLPLFFAVFAISYVGHGVGSVPRFDVIGRVIRENERGAFFARSNLVAGLLGFGTGFAVRALLASEEGGPPLDRFALLVLLSIAFFVLAVIAFAAIREPPGRTAGHRSTLWGAFRSIPGLMRSSAPYRRLVGVIVLTDVARRITDPFYIIFATEVLDAPISYAGVYLATLVAAKIAANILWEWIGRRFGNHRVLQGAAAAGLAVPAGALAFAVLLSHLGTASGLAFTVIFALMGVRDSGKYIGKRTVFLDLVPEEGWPTHWGALNTLLGAVSLLPVLAGTLIDVAGYTMTFAVVTAVASLGAGLSLRIRGIVGEAG